MTTRSTQPVSPRQAEQAGVKLRRKKRRSAESASDTAQDAATPTQARKSVNDGVEGTGASPLKRCLTNVASTGAGVSIVVHVVLLALLSLFVITQHRQEAPWLTSTFADEHTDNLELAELEQFTLEPIAASAPIEVVSAVVSPQRTIEPAFLSSDSPDTTDSASETGGAGVRPPGTANAVTKGSFTAWTIPADPAPREDYLVVILVRVPERIRKYEKEDLSGFLEGDDGYETPIGNFTGKGFPKQFYGQFDTTARRLVIRVPGAAAKVRDTIRIRSKVLREEQTMEIVF